MKRIEKLLAIQGEKNLINFKNIIKYSLLMFFIMSINVISEAQSIVGSISFSGADAVALNTNDDVWISSNSNGLIEKFNSTGSPLGVTVNAMVDAISTNNNDELYILASDSVRIYDDNGIFIESRGPNDGTDIEHNTNNNWYYIIDGSIVETYLFNGTIINTQSLFSNASAITHTPSYFMFAVADNGADQVEIWDDAFGSLIKTISIVNPNGVGFLSDATVVISHDDSLSFYHPIFTGSFVTDYYLGTASDVGGLLNNPGKMDVSTVDEVYLTNAGNEVLIVQPPPVVPLPIQLSNFDARIVNGRTILKWNSEAEINAEGFEVQHSQGGRNFNSLGFVASKGSGSNYQFQHRPNAGINYYRLRQIDLDGFEEFSKVVTVNYEQLQEAKIFPNPTNGLIEATMNAKIYNLVGQFITETKTDQKQFLKKGEYMIKFENGESQKLIVR